VWANGRVGRGSSQASHQRQKAKQRAQDLRSRPRDDCSLGHQRENTFMRYQQHHVSGSTGNKLKLVAPAR